MYYKRKMKFCTNNALYKFLCNRFLLFPSNPVDRLFSYSPIHSSISLIPIALNWSNKLIAEAVSPSLLSRNFPDGLPKKKKKKKKNMRTIVRHNLCEIFMKLVAKVFAMK